MSYICSIKLNNKLKLRTMANYLREQLIERVENLGGLVNDNYATFNFDEAVSNDNCESITLQDALNVEKQMMDLGFDGALIGHPFNEDDLTYIYFKIS